MSTNSQYLDKQHVILSQVDLSTVCRSGSACRTKSHEVYNTHVVAFLMDAGGCIVVIGEEEAPKRENPNRQKDMLQTPVGRRCAKLRGETFVPRLGGGMATCPERTEAALRLSFHAWCRIACPAIDRFDRWIAAVLLGVHERHAALTRPAAFFARRGPLLFFVEMAVILFVSITVFPATGVQHALRGLIVAVTAAVAAKLVIDPIARGVGRSRPFVRMSFEPLVHKDPYDPSFPSNHAGGAFALAVALGVYFPDWAIASWALAIVLSVARVFTGVHYVTDIVAGAVIGAVSAVTFSLVLGLR